MQKISWQARFRYWFDNLMGRGAGALIGLLSVASLIFIVLMAVLVTLAYNWTRLHASLKRLLVEPQGRRKYERRTPAMAAGLAERAFTLAELLGTPLYPSPAGSSH